MAESALYHIPTLWLYADSLCSTQVYIEVNAGVMNWKKLWKRITFLGLNPHDSVHGLLQI